MSDPADTELVRSGDPWVGESVPVTRLPWLALAIALLLHVAIVGVGFAHLPSHDKRLGDAAGEPEAITISMITEADLDRRTIEMTRPVPVPVPAPVPATRAQTPAQPSAPAQPQAAPPAPALDLSLDMTTQSLKPMLTQQPAAHPASSQEIQQALKSIDLAAKAPAAISAHKGKVDEFSRDVVRALARTKPGSPGGTGRVVVTFTLSEDGLPLDVHISHSSGSDGFDRTAMAAVWAAAFSRPPTGTSQQDRTFDIEYLF